MTERKTSKGSISLTDSQKTFLEQCELLFKDRYTEADEEFMAVHTVELCEPPIMPSYPGRPYERRMRYDNRRNEDNRRNDDNRYGERSNRDNWYQRQDRKRQDSGSRDYGRHHDKRQRYNDDSRESHRY